MRAVGANPAPATGTLTLWPLGGTAEPPGNTSYSVGSAWTLVSVPLSVGASNRTSMRAEIYVDTQQSVHDLALDEASFSAGNARPNSSVPIANAGPDQSVASGAKFTLDASGSSDPSDTPIAFHWAQIGGPLAVMDDPSKIPS